MALFDTLIGDVGERFGLGANAGPMVQDILRTMTGFPGGISGLFARLEAAGLSAQAASWLGQASPAPVPGQQISQFLGSEALDGLASRFGLSAAAVSTAAGYIVPRLVGLLTPGGQVPAALPSEVTHFLNPDATEPVRPAAIPVPREPPHWKRWLLPLLGVFCAIGFVLWFLGATAPVRPVVVEAAKSPPVPARPAQLMLNNEGGIVHFSGAVHDQDTKTAILNALKSVFGADKITGDIDVDANRAAAPWLAKFQTALEGLKIPGLQAMFDGNAINLGGFISDADRDRIIASLRSIFGGGLTFGTLGDHVADVVTGANTKVLGLLSSLKAGFTPADLVGALNVSIINFSTASAEIPASATLVLQNAAARIKELPATAELEIAGYTDNTGDEAANLTLSQSRADAVRNALIGYGVTPAMLVAKGYGSANPIASNDQLEGRFHNRRIEYHLVHS